MNRTVHFDYVPTTRRGVKTIDVLGEHAEALEVSRHFGERYMAGVGRRPAAGALDLGDILPGQLRVALEHGPGQGIFDRDAVVGEFAVVQPTDTAISGQARIRRHAGPRNNQHATCRAHHGDGTFDVVDGERFGSHAIGMGCGVVHSVRGDWWALPGYSALAPRHRQKRICSD